MKQFSYEEYRHILNWIKKNYNIMDYTDVTDDTESFAIIRHDVEFSPYRALKMAEIDNELGIKSSFFFQIRNNCYNSLSGDNIDIINKISNLGHYIGAHINTSNLSSNESLKSFVKKDMFILSEFIDTNVDRFSFHRPKSYQLKEYVKIDGYVNAYDEQFFHYFENKKPEKLRVGYFADSMHKWKYGYPTDSSHKKIQVVLHPYSWSESGFKNYDNFKSVIKEKNKELIYSINSECNNFPQELL